MKRTIWLAVRELAVAMTLAALLTASGWAQAAKRLILTDGSYQTATEWKTDGERVKYLSAERGEWEEIPVALVDWKATAEWNAARAEVQREEMKPVTEEEVTARKEDQLNTPQVAPELRLPSQGGVFLLEELAGKPVLSKVEGSKIQENDHAGKNLLKRSVDPISSQVQTIELKGPAAKARLHSASPSIFLDVEDDQGVIAGEDFRLVRLQGKKNLRILAMNKLKISGEQSQTENFLPARVEKFGGNWWKLIPLEGLTPGEYGIVISAPVDQGNTVVWDFGVDQ